MPQEIGMGKGRHWPLIRPLEQNSLLVGWGAGGWLLLPRACGPWPAFFPAHSLYLLPGQQSLKPEDKGGSLLREPKKSDRVLSNWIAERTSWSRRRRERVYPIVKF